ncbi:general stress protein [Timonella sp. A28]|uniref:general stress protein n=1 Tax=Timonella sp. A28 TaxID=3442640 RepID=UPI003EBE4473
MSMMTPNPSPRVPTMPGGNEIATYSTYLKAQKAVDALSDAGFAVQTVTIVGHDLHMVERVTGRLTYPRVALAGFASGAWFGLFVGLLLSLFGSNGEGSVILTAVVIGGGFGLLFSVLSYALTGGKRDFTSQSQIVAAKYVLLCSPETAGKARNLLREKGVEGDVVSVVKPVAPAATVQHSYGQQAPAAPAHTTEQSVSQPAPTVSGQPLTYGEALDAQKRAEREAREQASAPKSVAADAHAATPAVAPMTEEVPQVPASAPSDSETVQDSDDTAAASGDNPYKPSSDK